MEKNYYQVLGLKEGVTLNEIKAAYWKYAKKFHPDKQNGDEFFKERFQEIREAYEYLCQNYDKNSEVERYEDSNDPNDGDVYEQEDEDIVESEPSYINDKYYIKLLQKKELLEWFRFLNIILFSLMCIAGGIYLFPEAMQEKYDIVEWLDMSGTWLEPTIAFVVWLGFTFLLGFTVSYTLPILGIWATPIDRIEVKITEYKNRLHLNPYLDNETWVEILKTDFHYQELYHDFKKIKRKYMLLVIKIFALIPIIPFTWSLSIPWIEHKGWLFIFVLLCPVIICTLLFIIFISRSRHIYYERYIVAEQKIKDYKKEIINTYRKEGY